MPDCIFERRVAAIAALWPNYYFMDLKKHLYFPGRNFLYYQNFLVCMFKIRERGEGFNTPSLNFDFSL